MIASASFAGDAGAAEIEINAVPTEVMGGDTVVFMTQDQREIFVHLRGITGTSEAAINKLERLINEKPVICRNLDAKCDESAIGDCWALPDYATHGLTLSQRMQKSGLVSVSTVWSTKDYCSP